MVRDRDITRKLFNTVININILGCRQIFSQWEVRMVYPKADTPNIKTAPRATKTNMQRKKVKNGKDL